MSEVDPLMSCDFEADGELSEEEDSSRTVNDVETSEFGVVGSEPASDEFSSYQHQQHTNGNGIAEGEYVEHTPVSRLPIKQQPLMGVTSFSSSMAAQDSLRGGRRSSKSNVEAN